MRNPFSSPAMTEFEDELARTGVISQNFRSRLIKMARNIAAQAFSAGMETATMQAQAEKVSGEVVYGAEKEGADAQVPVL